MELRSTYFVFQQIKNHTYNVDNISEKVDKIKDWPVPKNHKEVHSFMCKNRFSGGSKWRTPHGPKFS